METINKRIDILINLLKMTPYEFSKKMGNSRPDALYNLLKNEDSQPSPKTLNKIKDNFPMVNYSWLLTGEGETFKSSENQVKEPSEKYHKIENDVVLLNDNDEIEIFRNKNGINFYLYPDDSVKIEVPILPFNAYASSQIECYFDENYTNKEFSKIQFTVDKIGKGVYLGFKTKNDSMNGGGLYDTPNKAEVLGREIGRQHWLSLHKNDYGFVLMTKSAILHKDITSYNSDTGMFMLHSRNPTEKDFEMSINDIYRIFNVIKRTF